MANLSNINNIFKFTDGEFLLIGGATANSINATETGIAISNANAASLSLQNTTSPDGNNFTLFSSSDGSFKIRDVGVGAGAGDRLVIDEDGDATFAGIIGVNGSTTANIPITATTSSGYEDVAYFKSVGTNINSRISLFPTGTGNGVVNSTANDLILQTSGVDKLTINSTTATFAGSITVNGISSTLNTGNSGTFVTNDSSGYPRITTADATAQLGLFRSGGSAGGMYIGADSGGLEIMTSAFATKFSLDNSGNGIFSGSVTATNFIGTLPTGQFLPLSGGTLTGALTGTSATFTGTVTAPNLNLTNLTQNTTSSLFLVKDEVLGAELVTNGDFDTATGWNLNSNWTISGGTCNADGTSNGDINQSQNVGVIGEKYRITYVISAYTQGTISARIGSSNTALNTGTGTFSQIVTATTTDRIRMNLAGSFIGSVDSLSIKQVTSSSDSVQERSLSSGAFGDELWAVTPTDSNNIYNLNSGDVGIGQDTPLNSLDVYRATGDASIRIQAETAANSTILKFRNSNADADITVDYTTSNQARMVFTTDNSGGYVPVLSLEANRDTLMYGNVGIGETSPQQKLHIKSTTSGPTGIIIENTNNAQSLDLDFWNNAGAVQGRIRYNEGGGTFSFFPNASVTSAMEILYNGNVGIGTVSPTNAKFVIQQDSSAASFGGNVCQLFENFNTTDGQMMSIGFRNNNSVGTTAYIDAVAYDQSIGATDIRFSTYSGSAWNGNMVTFQHTGRVGIGTTSPDAKLDIEQAAAGTTFVPYLQLSQTSTVADSKYGILFKNTTYGWDQARISVERQSSAANFDLVLSSAFSGNLVEGIRIDHLGNVGINTTSPTHKLDVTTSDASTWAVALKNTNANGYGLFVQGSETTNRAILAAYSGSSYKLWVRGDGNVGIGTVDPGGYKLNVSGTGYYSNQLTVDGFTNNAGISFRNGFGPTNTGIRAKAIGTANRDGVELLGYNGIDFSVNNGANVVMRIVGVTGSGMGNVGIGETSPDTTLHVKNSGSIVLTIERSGDGKAVSFTNGIQEVGDISYTGSNGVSYNSASDYRLKEDLQDFNGLDKISKIKMYDYKWKSGNDRSYGAMAHELQEIIPDAVSGEKDGEDMQGVDYSKVVPLLVKSIQEQQKQIEELKQIIKNK